MKRQLARAAYAVAHIAFLLLSCFTLLAPPEVLLNLHVWVWSWVLALPPLWWFWAFLKTLYRGGE